MSEAPAIPSAALVRYDTMCRAIDEAYSVDEVKDIRDKALAFEAYAKQAKNTEAERRACEIRLRAERKAGHLLSQLEHGKGGRPSETPDNAVGSLSPYRQAVKDAQLNEKTAERWQQLATVPEEDFEAALAAPEKPSTTGIIQKPKQDPMDPDALWLWGRLRDFEGKGILDRNHDEVIGAMTDAMRDDVARLSGRVADWLKGDSL